jgi:DNA-binding MarR family transcriptional regulator/N-acetylglutamate synthase-like GNAT family acetyltransferase
MERAMASTVCADDRIAAVRRFNRLYTRQIGVLRETLLQSPYSPTEARAIFELAQREGLTATELGRMLGLDTGYLSRVLGRLEQQGLLARGRSEDDGRQRLLHLTARGHEAFGLLDSRSCEEVAALLDDLSEIDQQRLLAAIRTIEDVLEQGTGFKFAEPYVLRPPEPGDLGWVVHRHGVLYAQEYGWDEQFEALVAQIAADFVRTFDPKRERCWIAELQGTVVGSVFLVQAGEATAKLRLLLVEPAARGLGVGTRLVQECVRFARRSGYQRITLWTQSVLVQARQIYQRAGFELVSQAPHHSFGHDLVEETWELRLP